MLKSRDTNSQEYAEWTAEVWRKNDARNKAIQTRQKSLQDEIAIAEIEAGLYEE